MSKFGKGGRLAHAYLPVVWCRGAVSSVRSGYCASNQGYDPVRCGQGRDLLTECRPVRGTDFLAFRIEYDHALDKFKDTSRYQV